MKIIKPTHHRGQTMVEFALLIPALLLLTVVMLDLGRGVYYYSVIYNAAREGARYGIIHPDDVVGIEAAARDLAIGLDQSKLIINPATIISDTIQVEVHYSFEPVTPLGLFSIDDFDLHTRSTMLIEQ
jgi:uncharacterized protein (UPF0333 family)